MLSNSSGESDQLHLDRFVGGARRGTEAPIDIERGLAGSILDWIDVQVEARAKIRFNLTGFYVEQAVTPGSKQYGSITSQEFRHVLQKHRDSVTFYRDGQELKTTDVQAEVRAGELRALSPPGEGQTWDDTTK